MEFCDFSVPAHSSGGSRNPRELAALEAKVRLLFALGYDRLALTITVRDRALSASDDACPPALRRFAATLAATAVSPASSVMRFAVDAPAAGGGTVPTRSSPSSSSSSSSSSKRKKKQKKKRKRAERAESGDGDGDAAAAAGTPPLAGRVLTRLTVETASSQLVRQVADGACGRGVFAAVVASYDLLAVRPTSQAAFDAVCKSFAPPAPRCFDIIAIDATVPRPLFRLDRALVSAARKRGAVFELCYAPALRDPGVRAHFFANAAELLRALGGHGRGVLLSSAAADAMEARAPLDVMNLAVVAGFSAEHAAAAVGARAVGVIEYAARRHALRAAGVLRRGDGGAAATATRKAIPTELRTRDAAGADAAAEWSLLDFDAAYAESVAHAEAEKATAEEVGEEE